MKNSGFFLLLFLLTQPLLQAQTQASSSSATIDPKYFDKLKWRNIGPPRGGRSLGEAVLK